MQNINRVIITGNLTRDPETRETPSGTTVCRLRVAVNSRVKQQGEWTDKPNYFDVTCFGAMATNVARYMAKGRALAVDGRLEWREWEQDGQKRQAVGIIADSIQFLSDGNGQREHEPDVPAPAVSSASGGGFAPAADDDIPF